MSVSPGCSTEARDSMSDNLSIWSNETISLGPRNTSASSNWNGKTAPLQALWYVVSAA